MTKETLKSCPFCGGEAAWCGSGVFMDGDYIHECHQITCKTCHIQFDLNGPHNPELMKDLRKITAKAWNQRT